MTALSRSVGGNGSAAIAELAAGSSGTTLASSISAMRITPGLSQHLRPAFARAAGEAARPAGGWRLATDSGPRCSSGNPRSNPERRSLPPGPTRRHHPLGVSGGGSLYEGQRLQPSHAVQPVSVIGDHEHRRLFRKIRQQGQDSHPGEQRVGNNVRSAARPRALPAEPVPAWPGLGQRTAPAAGADAQPGVHEFRLRIPGR